MDKQKNEEFLKELKMKLDWYIMEATDEEYDEKVVESMQYLLDRLEPMKEGTAPDVDEAWENLWALALEKDKQGVLVAEADETERAMNTGLSETSGGKKISESDKITNGNKVSGGGSNKLIAFMAHHKTIVAAAFLALVFAVGVSVQTEAIRSDGFFQWLRKDETGMQMVTSPDGLGGELNVASEETCYDRETIPAWAKKWAELELRVMDGEKYEWQYIYVSEYPNRKMASSHYLSEGEMVTLGIVSYKEEMSVNTESFGKYEYIKSITCGQEELKVYQKEETSGEIYYRIDFFADNQYYYLIGRNNLQELEAIAEKYVQNVEK